MGTVFGIEMRHKKAVDGNNANCFVRNVAVASGLVYHSQTINSYLFWWGGGRYSYIVWFHARLDTVDQDFNRVNKKISFKGDYW